MEGSGPQFSGKDVLDQKDVFELPGRFRGKINEVTDPSVVRARGNDLAAVLGSFGEELSGCLTLDKFFDVFESCLKTFFNKPALSLLAEG